ncbi:MAG: 16S rRNA (guanine(527)-N(7))-methyltransferase RsmG [Methylococcus sp.]|nr:MAG: 16S rRNA (guanine(527)-N(7))-methyltransferase RsmG [Methylococcus sp.]
MDLDSEQLDRLLGFLDLLDKWGQTYNLTAIRDQRSAVDRHLLDSLAVHAFLSGGQRVLDVGTGAGLPGIPLAIVNPGMTFVLLDRSSKKIRFVRQVIMSLGLKNVEAVAMRVEDFAPAALFDVVLARAFASLAEIWRGAAPLLTTGGRVLAMKGQWPEAEIRELGTAVRLRIHAVPVPGMGAERHLVEMSEN